MTNDKFIGSLAGYLLGNTSSYCNEINARYIGVVTDYLSEVSHSIKNTGRKARDGYINLDMIFVALWCLYWRIYYKEL